MSAAHDAISKALLSLPEKCADEFERRGLVVMAKIQVNALRRDKERLDWLEKTSRGVNVYFDPTTWMVDLERTEHPTLRAAIDAARKEAKP